MWGHVINLQRSLKTFMSHISFYIASIIPDSRIYCVALWLNTLTWEYSTHLEAEKSVYDKNH